jgi:hypothetical protein
MAAILRRLERKLRANFGPVWVEAQSEGSIHIKSVA